MIPFPMNNAVEILWQLVPRFVTAGDICVDATVGNGKDTAALCRIVGSNGHVYGFDIQNEALEQASLLLNGSVPETSFTLIHASHALMSRHVTQPVDLVLFNLGYLPGGDKSITTKSESTLKAMASSLELLKCGGKLAAVLYPGPCTRSRRGSGHKGMGFNTEPEGIFGGCPGLHQSGEQSAPTITYRKERMNHANSDIQR